MLHICNIYYINFHRYQIVTTRSLDIEQEVTINTTISCTDLGSPPLTSSEYIEVNVADENDNTPIFEKEIYEVSHIINYIQFNLLEYIYI